MGGLISSTVLTLIVLPYIAYVVESLSLWMGRTWRAGAPRPTSTRPAWHPSPSPKET